MCLNLAFSVIPASRTYQTCITTHPTPWASLYRWNEHIWCEWFAVFLIQQVQGSFCCLVSILSTLCFLYYLESNLNFSCVSRLIIGMIKLYVPNNPGAMHLQMITWPTAPAKSPQSSDLVHFPGDWRGSQGNDLIVTLAYSPTSQWEPHSLFTSICNQHSSHSCGYCHPLNGLNVFGSPVVGGAKGLVNISFKEGSICSAGGRGLATWSFLSGGDLNHRHWEAKSLRHHSFIWSVSLPVGRELQVI